MSNINFPQNVLLRIFDFLPLRELVDLRLVNRMCKTYVDSKIQGPIDFIIDRAYLQSFKDSDACYVKARIIAGDIRRARVTLNEYAKFDETIKTLDIHDQVRRIGQKYGRRACIHDHQCYRPIGVVSS